MVRDDESKPRSVLGRNIRLIRESRRPKISQRKLAELAGLDRSVIARLEAGLRTSATLDSIRAIARALGVTEADLVGPLADQYPRGFAEVQPLIDRFEEQEFGPAPKVRATSEEIAWLRSLPGVYWTDMPPTLETLAHLVQAYRSRRLDPDEA